MPYYTPRDMTEAEYDAYHAEIEANKPTCAQVGHSFDHYPGTEPVCTRCHKPISKA